MKFKDLSQEQLQALGVATAIGGTLFVGTSYLLQAMKDKADEIPGSQSPNEDTRKYERRRLLDAFVNWTEVEKGYKQLTNLFNENSGGGGR